MSLASLMYSGSSGTRKGSPVAYIPTSLAPRS